MKKLALVVCLLAAFGASAIEIDDAVWTETTNRVSVLWNKHVEHEKFLAAVKKKREEAKKRRAAKQKEIEEKKRQREMLRNLGKTNKWDIKPKGAK